jgi:hypothetical protein
LAELVTAGASGTEGTDLDASVAVTPEAVVTETTDISATVSSLPAPPEIENSVDPPLPDVEYSSTPIENESLSATVASLSLSSSSPLPDVDVSAVLVDQQEES